MDIIESGRRKNTEDGKITDALKITFEENDLANAVTLASDFKCTYEQNKAIIRNRVENFCINENAQYKGVIDSLLKSSTSRDMKRDIEFLKFAFSIMNDHLTFAHDDANAYYEKTKDVLNRLIN